MRDITLCHPRLQLKADQWIEACKKQGIIVKISETLRTAAEQDALYAQGRIKPGKIVTNAKGSSYQSQHQWGIAYDFYLSMDVDGDGQVSDDAYNDSTNLFARAGSIAKELGLAWGGDWSSIVDKPHIYLPDWGSTSSKLKAQYGTPEKFMKTWEILAGWIQDATGWWYRRDDGSYPVSKWEELEWHGRKNWYYFNSAGYMKAGTWQQTGDKWYYLGPDGAMVASCVLPIGGEVFAFDKTGAMITGPVTLRTNDRGALAL